MKTKQTKVTKKAETNTQQEYYQSMKQIAQEVFDNAVESFPDNKDRLHDEAFDNLHQAVDGNYWVIYTHAAMDALRVSKNDDAIFDQGEGLGDVSSMSEVYTKAAYWTVYQDVSEELQELIDNYEVPEEAEEEEEASDEE